MGFVTEGLNLRGLAILGVGAVGFGVYGFEVKGRPGMMVLGSLEARVWSLGLGFKLYGLGDFFSH